MLLLGRLTGRLLTAWSFKHILATLHSASISLGVLLCLVEVFPKTEIVIKPNIEVLTALEGVILIWPCLKLTKYFLLWPLWKIVGFPFRRPNSLCDSCFIPSMILSGPPLLLEILAWHNKQINRPERWRHLLDRLYWLGDEDKPRFPPFLRELPPFR